MTNLISFRPRPRPTMTPPDPASRRRSARPVTSLQLVLRSAPEHLQPAAVAAELLDTGSNAAAAPIWAERRAEFKKMLAARRLAPADYIHLNALFRQAVRSAGITEKARRREDREAAFRFFEQMGSGALPDPA